jgi:cobalt-zinc-cadmium efflux system protein
MESKKTSNALLLSLLLNTLLTVVEMVIGIISGSLALVADGARNLTDSLLLTVSFIAERLSRRKPDDLRTWGYGRIKVIASLLNTGIILTIAIIIGYEAISRFNEPKNVKGITIILAAALSVFINALAALLLKKQKDDINIRTAYTGLKFGAISSAGVLIAGVFIVVFKWNWVDNVAGIAISALLLFASFRLAAEAVHILLEGVPASINMKRVKKSLIDIEHVTAIREVHAWTLEHQSYAFSCQLVIKPSQLSISRVVVNEARKILMSEFGFTHITIEVDVSS